jgi:serine/threonine protein kinase
VHEARLLARVKEANNEKPNHVVKIIDFSERLTIDEVESDIGGISLDLIVGKSLEELIKSNSCRDKVLRYGSHLMEGLLELQRAGIWYHRDLRPGNIIVDERSDAAVIIDLGIATDDRNALPKDNRRFGGPNDLVSLGQIMYYIATGKHIFDKSQSMSLTLVRDEIKDYRDDAYSDTTGKLLAGHLAQVDKTVCDTKTKIAIKECLQAKLDDYQRIHEMFKSLV